MNRITTLSAAVTLALLAGCNSSDDSTSSDTTITEYQ